MPNNYLRELNRILITGRSTEHSFRPALKQFIESLDSNLDAFNEPRRIDCGAPDFQVFRGSRENRLSIGYIETKDIGVSLDAFKSSDQGKRYTNSLQNLILTDYLEFRWFVEGQLCKKAALGRLEDKEIRKSKTGTSDVVQLLKDFISHQPEPIARADDLAKRMAGLTRAIREVISESFRTAKASEGLKSLFESFRKQLIPHLEQGQFADMFAQTLSYGLFAARVTHDDSTPFRWETAVREIPRSMPFLKELFEYVTRARFDDEPHSGYVEDLTQVLAYADMSAVLKDFGRESRQKDPVLHFYETFLAAYDPTERERRGVYYTPESVVSYIVRSVDEILKRDFGCRDGLGDKSRLESDDGDSHRVLILDPACGTGSFLYGIVEHLRGQFSKSKNAGEWKDYVTEHLIPRLFGFELLMAPYAVAHFKLALQLEARHLTPAQRKIWAADLSSVDRLNIFLTDTLERWQTIEHTLSMEKDFISREVEAAADIKSKFPILVVLGNPPYSGHSASKSQWIKDLVKDYKYVDGLPLGEKNPKWLQDDYVKFIRFGQWRIEQTGQGILAFITNHAYLDNPTFRGMRQKLMQTFDDIYILNLHGNVKKKEKATDGGKDENVFDIQQGVAIGVFVKKPLVIPTQVGIQASQIQQGKVDDVAKTGTDARLDSRLRGNDGGVMVRYADLYGRREVKEDYLLGNNLTSTKWQTLSPSSPHYLFIPQDDTLRVEYEKGIPINKLFPVNSVGIVTARDSLTIAFTKEELIDRVREFLRLKPEEARERFNLGKDVRDWKVELAQKDLRRLKPNWEAHITPILYRPFDVRWTVYSDRSRGFLCMPRPKVMKQMLGGGNVAITFHRREEINIPYTHFLVTDLITEHGLMSSKTTNSQSPLLLSGKTANIGRAFSEHKIKPMDILRYVYAVCYSYNYRTRYIDFLRLDFPRIPFTKDKRLFKRLADLGGQLIDLHLLKSPLLDDTGVSYPIPGDDVVGKGFPKFTPPTPPAIAGGDSPILLKGGTEGGLGRVYINKDQYFAGVPKAAWEFHIGGYQVLEKWLKDRRSRVLSSEDREHYRKVVKALVETIRIMKEIDEAIPGWPLE